MQNSQYIVSIKPAGRGSRTRDTILTLFMWGIYVYLWIPLITLGAWMFGFERFYEIMITYGGFEVAVKLFDLYILMIMTIAFSVVGWSGFNYFRFHHNERRLVAPVTQTQKLGEFFEISEPDIERARNAKVLQIDLDDGGSISRIMADRLHDHST